MSQLLRKGAEAYLFIEDLYGYKVVRKQRLPKIYRVTQLDETIRRERTIREARLLSSARRAGVRTPIVFIVDYKEATIIMEYIEGHQLKELLPNLSPNKRRKIFQTIGGAVARLHQGQICHGDLTTSNLILHPKGKIYFVDFGLAATTQSIEDFGTDLHLLRRALLSAHHKHWKECFKTFKKEYQSLYGDGATQIFQKIAEIESRGRYITERL